MSAKALLQDPCVALSVAWAALEAILGPSVRSYEPDTLRIELERRGIAPMDGLMAKLLAAQTVLTSHAWTYDYDVLFAFALACAGIPSASEAIHHPTPEQLCWGIRELERLVGIGLSHDGDEGFDPDVIDPAVAILLHHEGYVVAPTELRFSQAILSSLSSHDDLIHEVETAWSTYASANIEVASKAIAALDESACSVQLARLLDCRRYVLEHETLRAQQYVSVRPGF